MKKIFSLVTVALLGLFLLVSCGTKYTVTFETNGGSEIEAVEVAEGNTLTLPADPTKEGAEFSGWFVDDKCREEYDKTKPVSKDMTLYAKWLVTITFDSMGGSEVAPLKGVFNDVVSPTGLPESTKEGFVFAGWYRDKEYTQEQPNLFPKASLTLYAKWSIKDDSTALNFNQWIVNDKDQYSYKVNEDGSHTFATVDPSLVLEKYGGEWDGLTTKATGKDIKDMKSLTVEVEAKKGQKVLLKVNDQNSGEKWVEFTEDGKQTVKIDLAKDLPNLVIDEGKTALAILAGAGVNARSGEFKFTKIEFSNDAAGDALKTVNLLDSVWNENASYVFNNYKTTGTYSFVKTNINHNVQKYNAVVMTIVGTKDKEILLKLEGGGIEANVEKAFKMTGEEQTIYWVVSETNLTKTGGEMFLWFLNPGVEGAGAEVTIKSASLVKLVDIGQENKEATIFFNENGGTKVSDITAPIGSPVTIPAAPTREGYAFIAWLDASGKPFTFDKMGDKSVELFAEWYKVSYNVTFNNNEKGEAVESETVGFLPALPELEEEGFVLKGWYYDAEFTKQAKEGDEVNENITLYAKWEEDNAVKVVDLLADTFKELDANTYTFKVENGVLKIQKTGTGSYQFAVGSTLGSAIEGTDKLVVVIKGVAGQKITFKINDQNNPWEKEIVCDGTVQTVVFDTSELTIDKNKVAVSLFVNGGVEAASEVFEIYELYYTNGAIPSSLMADTFKELDANTYTFKVENGVLKIQKIGTGSYQFAVGSSKGDVIKGMNYLNVTIKGVAGQKITFKINDQNNPWEKEIVCDGTVQYLSFDLTDLKIDENKPALSLFINGGVEAASEVFEIYKLEYSVHKNDVSLITDEFKELDANTYTFNVENGVLKVKKTGTGSYQFAVGSTKGASIEGYKTLKVAIKGVAGQKITFKVNDQNNPWEKEVECTGVYQIVTFDLSDLTVDANKPAVSLFINGGVEAASEVFEIYELAYTDYIA